MTMVHQTPELFTGSDEKKKLSNEELKAKWKVRTIKYWTSSQYSRLKKGLSVNVLLKGKFYEFRVRDKKEEQNEKLQKQIDSLMKKAEALKSKIKE